MLEDAFDRLEDVLLRGFKMDGDCKVAAADIGPVMDAARDVLRFYRIEQANRTQPPPLSDEGD